MTDRVVSFSYTVLVIAQNKLEWTSDGLLFQALREDITFL